MAYHAHFFFQQFHARITGPSTEKKFIKLNTSPTTENKDKKLYTIFQPQFSKVKSAQVILVIFELTMGARIWNAMIDQN